ncbi:MAG: C40 family peptidase, partial [Anaerolineae bacterium]
DWGRCALTGAVLDAATLADVLRRLAEHFPGLELDAAWVEVLRRPQPAYLYVATNLTGLYAGPSFLAEQLSELLNGQRLELLQEQERWCFVRQDDGYLGWAYRPYLTADPAPVATHIVCEPVSLLRAGPSAAAEPITRVPGGTLLAVQEAASAWLKVALAGGPEGWVAAADLIPLADLPADEAGRRAHIVANARRFIGVPYLWGGCTALGIDCSGFAQLLHRLAGVILPRDADMQYAAGEPVEPPYRPGDLLFFGETAGRPKITHVAVSLGGWRIIHSSRSRNGVYEDDVQAVPHLRESFIAGRTFVRSAPWTM